MTLAGRGVLVPRGGEAGERWSAAIRQRGGWPYVVPLIETAPPLDPIPFEDAVAAWNRGGYDWVVVTSPRGAEALARAGAQAADDRPIAAVGPATAAELRRHGLTAALVPAEEFSAAGLAELLRSAIPVPAKLLLPLSEIAGTELETALRDAGHDVDRVDAYRTLPTADDPVAAHAVAAGSPEILLASSASVAREIARRFAPLPPASFVVAMGEPTARALQRSGIAPDVVAAHHTIAAMLDAAEQLLAARITGPGAPHPSAEPTTANRNTAP
ncbi:uroporphyrinogen-III synthase [Leucobacter sp. gxy201]|uniref:uroporphyrinogen-III synthase n=1 Tax=Leucobacter sp. gxy201 TaxID=2957200 RepID=UPI003D9FC203